MFLLVICDNGEHTFLLYILVKTMEQTQAFKHFFDPFPFKGVQPLPNYKTPALPHFYKTPFVWPTRFWGGQANSQSQEGFHSSKGYSTFA